jgi:predicted AAA+ superfamily ATPase
LAAASLSANSKMLQEQLNLFGFFFENYVIKDLKVYAISNGYTIHYFRDSRGNEIDLILKNAEND